MLNDRGLPMSEPLKLGCVHLYDPRVILIIRTSLDLISTC